MSTVPDFDTFTYYATLPAEARLRTVVRHLDYIREVMRSSVACQRVLVHDVERPNAVSLGMVAGLENALTNLTIFDAVLAKTRADMVAEDAQRAADSAETT